MQLAKVVRFMEQQKNEVTSEQYKLLLMMLTRSTQIAMAASYFTIQLIETLHEKGIIDKSDIEQKALKMGYSVLKSIEEQADALEAEIKKEKKPEAN